MDMQNLVTTDMYQLDLWAGTQLLWSHNFTPSQHGEGWRVDCKVGRWARTSSELDELPAPFWASVSPSWNGVELSYMSGPLQLS